MNKGQNGWYIQTTYAKAWFFKKIPEYNFDHALPFGESKNFSQLYNLIEKNSQNDRKYYRIENFQDSDFGNFIERKYWKQLIQHLVRYQQVRQVFESEC